MTVSKIIRFKNQNKVFKKTFFMTSASESSDMSSETALTLLQQQQKKTNKCKEEPATCKSMLPNTVWHFMTIFLP